MRPARDARRLQVAALPALERLEWAHTRISDEGVLLLGSQIVSNVPLILLIEPWIRGFPDQPLAWTLTALVSTLAGRRASETVPVASEEALRLVRPLPLPESVPPSVTASAPFVSTAAGSWFNGTVPTIKEKKKGPDGKDIMVDTAVDRLEGRHAFLHDDLGDTGEFFAGAIT